MVDLASAIVRAVSEADADFFEGRREGGLHPPQGTLKTCLVENQSALHAIRKLPPLPSSSRTKDAANTKAMSTAAEHWGKSQEAASKLRMMTSYCRSSGDVKSVPDPYYGGPQVGKIDGVCGANIEVQVVRGNVLLVLLLVLPLLLLPNSVVEPVARGESLHKVAIFCH